jgi:hypothetical protein
MTQGQVGDARCDQWHKERGAWWRDIVLGGKAKRAVMAVLRMQVMWWDGGMKDLMVVQCVMVVWCERRM